uniref:Uncharacterized protein n=1 Tax=Anopheles albimanus TaxID=7167 RepID=A0A182FX11_ANOAL
MHKVDLIRNQRNVQLRVNKTVFDSDTDLPSLLSDCLSLPIDNHRRRSRKNYAVPQPTCRL